MFQMNYYSLGVNLTYVKLLPATCASNIKCIFIYAQAVTKDYFHYQFI